ncbi:MAG: hypothetical protein K8R88_10760 [Armatimonadetes bacterium]|nr:hypothetical protein [Armatimonadota bacterium]
MNRRLSLSLAAFAALTAVSFAQFTSGPTSKKTDAPLTVLTKEQREEVLTELNGIVTKVAFVPGVEFAKWPEYLATQKDLLDKATTPNEFARAVNSALARFGASHIVFSTPEAVAQQRTGNVVGLGIAPELVPEGLKINDVFEGSAAFEAGLEAGDIIIEGNGKKPDNVTALRGEEGTKIKIKVKKAKDGSIKELTITRRAFSIFQKEELKWLNADTAILKIPSFMQYDRGRVESLMKEVKDKNAKTLAVDLRSNGGGYVFNLQHLMGLTMSKDDKIGVFITRSIVDSYIAKTKGEATDFKKIADFAQNKLAPLKTTAEPFSGRLMCLINGGTGSASEIFAAGVQDTTGGVVIGTRSAGAVLGSLMRPLKYNFQIQYPFQDYVTIKGVRLEGNGVEPNLIAGTPRSKADPDPAVDKILKSTTPTEKKG